MGQQHVCRTHLNFFTHKSTFSRPMMSTRVYRRHALSHSRSPLCTATLPNRACDLDVGDQKPQPPWLEQDQHAD